MLAEEPPVAEVAIICSLTGLPVLSRPEWTDVRLDEGYEATFFFLGDSILVGRPSGRATMSGIRRLMALTEEIQAQVFTPQRRYIRIVDLTNLKGISLRARKYFSDEMKKRLKTRCMIFCGVSTFASLSVQLANRLHMMPYPLEITADYREAARLALRLVSEKSESSAPDRSLSPPREAPGIQPTAPDSPIDTYVDDVLAYLKGLRWDEDGVSSAPQSPADHPFRPVFESIDLIKQDLDSLFHRHQKALVEIRHSQDGMWSRVAERTAALTASNESLQEKVERQGEVISGIRSTVVPLLEEIESFVDKLLENGDDSAKERHAEALAAIREKSGRFLDLIGR